MTKSPPAMELFALYHLGLDTDGTYKFRNLGDCARRWGADNQTVTQWLQKAGIDAETVKRVPFNLTRCHVDAQFVKPEGAAALVRQAWDGYQAALRQSGRGEFQFDVNYDNVWADGNRKEPDQE